MLVHIFEGLVDDHLREVLTSPKDLFVIVVEIVIPLPMKKVVSEVVDETGEMPKMLFEALIEWTVTDLRA